MKPELSFLGTLCLCKLEYTPLWDNCLASRHPSYHESLVYTCYGQKKTTNLFSLHRLYIDFKLRVHGCHETQKERFRHQGSFSLW